MENNTYALRISFKTLAVNTMNFSSFFGFFGGFAAVAYTIFDQLNENEGMSFMNNYVDPGGVMLVLVGSVMATYLKSSGEEAMKLPILLFLAFRKKVEKPTKIIDKLVELGTLARKDGLIALQNQEIPDKFMAAGIQMLVDGSQPQAVKQTLAGDLLAMKLRHKHSGAVISYLGEVLPAMGMIGTLVGLVGLLSNMSNIASLGGNMATAVLTTFYGALFANAFVLPCANKLSVLSDLEALNREIIIEGIQFIQAGGNPRLMEGQLQAYLAPRLRTALV